MPESNLTKKAIALSAKELTKEKPYDKISISDIADRCGIKRQTFYYHFQDKYELLVWIYFNELFAISYDCSTISSANISFNNVVFPVPGGPFTLLI